MLSPSIARMHTRIIPPFNNHHAADNRTVAMDIYDAPDHGAMNNMAGNDTVAVVSTPAIPMPGFGGGGLGEGAKEDRA